MPYAITSLPSPSERKTLRDYQAAGYERFKNEDSAFLAMEMRLGKSLLALRLAREAWSCSRIFIFAPKIVLLAWEEELAGEGLHFHTLADLPNRIRADIISEGARGIFLLNYEAVVDRGVAESIETRSGVDCYILDECTTVKSASAKTTQFFLRTSDLVPKKILLSGLPTPEDWSNIWSQCAILNNGFWMGTSSYWNWINKHATKDTYGHFFTPKQAVAVREEFRKLSYCLSRKDAGLGEVKIRTIRNGDLPASARKVYNTIHQEWEVPGLDDDPTETNYAMVVTSWMHRLCGGHLPTGPIDSWKYRGLESVLCTEVRKEKAVVWFAFNDEIFQAERTLRGKRRTLTLTGADSVAVRREKIRQFRGKEYDTLLIQQRLGKFGLDLSCANVAVYFSNNFSLEFRAQSEDRIVMPGKKDPLLYIDFITKDTIEVDIYNGLRDKKVDAKWLVARARVDVRRSRS